MEKFCGKCGQELVKEEMEGFNVDTGKRNFRMVCPVRKCEHTGTDHISVYPGLFGRTVTCGRPGCNFMREMFDGI